MVERTLRHVDSVGLTKEVTDVCLNLRGDDGNRHECDGVRMVSNTLSGGLFW